MNTRTKKKRPRMRSFLFGANEAFLAEHEVGYAYEDASLMKCCFATIRNASLHGSVSERFILRRGAMLHFDEVDASFLYTRLRLDFLLVLCYNTPKVVKI